MAALPLPWLSSCVLPDAAALAQGPARRTRSGERPDPIQESQPAAAVAAIIAEACVREGAIEKLKSDTLPRRCGTR